MYSENIEVINKFGIHARPAMMIIQRAAEFLADITLEYNGTRADSKSIMEVMMLAAARGATVTVTADGKDEKEAVAAIRALFEEKFKEE